MLFLERWRKDKKKCLKERNMKKEIQSKKQKVCSRKWEKVTQTVLRQETKRRNKKNLKRMRKRRRTNTINKTKIRFYINKALIWIRKKRSGKQTLQTCALVCKSRRKKSSWTDRKQRLEEKVMDPRQESRRKRKGLLWRKILIDITFDILRREQANIGFLRRILTFLFGKLLAKKRII